jgi:YVTN family beta-propeller protein
MIAIVAVVTALTVCPASSQVRSKGAILTSDDIPFDNVAGRLVDFSTAAIHPIEFSRDGSTMYALNQPGAHLAILDRATLTRIGDVPIGIGAVSVVLRPGTDELWVVDSVDSCVSVVDPALRAIVRTVRVGGEPYGIAFPPTGDRAYVTCSGVDRVDVIDAATFSVAKSISIPARCPRGIAWLRGRAFVVSFLSGNGTAPMGSPSDPFDVHAIGVPGPPSSIALPDRDLFAIRTRSSIQQDDLDPSATLSGLGTTLFNLHVRPGTNELWIPNTDALNAVHKGEVNFVAGQVVRNRITIVDGTGHAPPRFVDLDAIAPPETKCAQPAYVEFDPVEPRVYVCGYGSDLVAVLRIDGGGQVTWDGSIDLPPAVDHARGTGPRACRVDPSRSALIVHNTNDASVSPIALASLPSGGGWSLAAAPARKLGVDLTSLFEHIGRHVFTDSRVSLSKTSSCASCHVDGHTDGLVWDLSHYLEPEGTPDDQLVCGTDVKGPMVTQSVRRMEESGPYHWRGEIPSIDGFQKAFVNLLEHTVNGVPAGIGSDFEYMLLFVDRLAWPPNPREPLDRRYDGQQLRGATLFLTRPLRGTLTCGSCHPLPLGSAGEIVTTTAGGMIHAADVPGMRGVGDKPSIPFAAGGPYGERTTTGAGFTHAGAAPTLKSAFLNSLPVNASYHDFALSDAEAEDIAAFLSVFDTGIAPAAAYLVTANASNWAGIAANELKLLRDAAGRGHCDLVYHRVPRPVLGQMAELSGMYDPATGKYKVASSSAAEIDEATLLAEAAAGQPVTFVGVPIGMGEPQGLDRDMDGLMDLDEIAAHTNPEVPDTDGDGFPDGYEVLWGMNPLQPDTSSPDTQAPSVVGPVRLLYATTNSLKCELETSEFCRVSVSTNGGQPVTRIPFNQVGDHHHWFVLNELHPDTDYRITLEMRDVAGNVGLDSSAVFHTRPRITAEPSKVEGIMLAVVQVPSGTQLHAEVSLMVGHTRAGPLYVVTGALYQVAYDGSVHSIASSVVSSTNAAGRASFAIDLPPAGSSPGTLYFVVQDVVAPPNGAAYALGMSRRTVETISY